MGLKRVTDLLQNRQANRQGSAGCSKKQTSRRLGFETLEERQMLSANSPDVDWPLTEHKQSTADTHEGHAHSHTNDRLVNTPDKTNLFESGGYLSGPSEDAPLDIALSYLRDNAASLGLSASDFDQVSITDQYVSEKTGTTHIYLRQLYNGKEVVGADININVTADGRVLNVGSSFLAGLGIEGAASATAEEPILTAYEALGSLSDHFGWTLDVPAAAMEHNQDINIGASTTLAASGVSYGDIPAELHYVPTADGDVELAWNLIVETVDGQHWYDSSIDATDGELISLFDWASHAFYNVYAQPKENPSDGSRSIEIDPADATASPFGWHDTDGSPGAEFTVTRGNNVYAYADRNDNNSPDPDSSPDGDVGLIFDFPVDLSQAPSEYQDAAVTNLFYWNNIIHDIHYAYGFDEASGNFQVNNYGNGGVGNDAVRAEAQDGADTGNNNNANMLTPPDGVAPRMQMYVWNRTNPKRDGDLDNGIIIHEYGHGVSNRLTGGPGNSSALQANQSRGMGEGWSDWHALMLTQKSTDTANEGVGIGTYALGQPANGPGIRTMRYSYDMGINSHTYSSINDLAIPHGVGEVWAATLWDLNWALIEGNSLDPNLPDAGMGFDTDLYSGTGGNNLAMQLVMDGMKLQPANPSFLDARDAIIMADQVLTGGANSQTIWAVFARRGMGFSADDGGNPNSVIVTEAFDVPASSKGFVQLDAASYEIGETVMITVRDIDIIGSGSTSITIGSTSGDTETVSLTHQGAGVFTGSITISDSGSSGDGNLNANSGDIITATYNDADDGTGNPAVATATASVIKVTDIFFQDFESGLGTNETTSGLFTINSSNSILNNGTKMMGHPGTYSDHEYSFYEFSLDLTNQTDVVMEFEYKAFIEDHFDGFNVLASSSTITPPFNLLTPVSGLTYDDQLHAHRPELGRYTYDTNGHLDSGLATFDLSAFEGKVVNIRMQFGTDFSVTGPGINIDNLRVFAADIPPEPVDLEIVTLTPADNGVLVSESANLIITFNQEIQKGTGNFTIKRTSDNSTFATIDVTSPQVTVEGAAVIIDPLVDLASLTDYYVLMDPGTVKDLLDIGFTGISGSNTWNFTTADTSALLFHDDFSSTTFDPANWSLIDNAVIDSVGRGEPTGIYSARLNGHPTSGDKIESVIIDLSTQSSAEIRYYYQAGGNGEIPGPDDHLILEYKHPIGIWLKVEQQVSDNPNPLGYIESTAALPPSAFHSNFQFRFRTIGDSNPVIEFDDWLIDDIKLVDLPPLVTVDTLFTNDSTPELSGTVDDPYATIVVDVGGQVGLTATNNGDGTWTLADNTLTTLSDNTYEVEVTATDLALNVGNDDSNNELTIDTISPVVTVDILATADSTPDITGTVDDPGASILVDVGSQTDLPATNNGNGTWILSGDLLLPLADNTYDVSVTATDATMNVGVDSTTNELAVDVLPIVTVDALLTNDSTPGLSGNIDDPAATVLVDVGGQTGLVAINNEDGTWTLPDNTLSALPNGTYDVVVSATDATFNVSMDSTFNELTINNTLLFFDFFPSNTFDPLKWSMVDNAIIDKVGLNEPTAPNALRFNGNPDGSDMVESVVIDLSGLSDAELTYYYQVRGGGDSPEEGDDLILEYKNSGDVWIELERQLGLSQDMSNFAKSTAVLPVDALHSGFQFRIRSVGSPNTVNIFDDWFVDDITINEIPPNADFDGDNDVDGIDFLVWQRNFGKVSPNANPEDGDSDGDKDVDSDDFDNWASQFGQVFSFASESAVEVQEQPQSLQPLEVTSVNSNSASAISEPLVASAYEEAVSTALVTVFEKDVISAVEATTVSTKLDILASSPIENQLSNLPANLSSLLDTFSLKLNSPTGKPVNILPAVSASVESLDEALSSDWSVVSRLETVWDWEDRFRFDRDRGNHLLDTAEDAFAAIAEGEHLIEQLPKL